MRIISAIKNRLIDRRVKEDRWDRTVRWLLAVIVFLAPLFFLPQVAYPIEFGKTVVFIFLVLTAAVVYLLRVFIRRQMTVAVGAFDWTILALVVLSLVSYIFSRQHYFSTIGASGYYQHGIMGTVCFVLFAYLLRQVIKRREDIIVWLAVFASGALIAGIYAVVQMFGRYMLPWVSTRTINFNSMSPTIEGFAVLIGISLLICFGLLMLVQKKWQRITLWAGIALLLFVEFLANQQMGLYCTAVSFFVLLLLVAQRSKYFGNVWIIMPTLLLTLLVLFSFINSSSFTKITLAESTMLDHSTSLAVAWKSVVHAPLWGSGPQTFALDFEEYRTAAFNNSAIWNFHFIKGSNEIFTLMATIGLGGLIVYAVIWVWFFVRMLMFLIRTRKPDQEWVLTMLLLVVWVALAVISFFMPFTFLLTFVWWFVLALGCAVLPAVAKQQKTIPLNGSPVRVSFGGVVFVALIVGVVVIALYTCRVCRADHFFARAQGGVSENKDIVLVHNDLLRAVQLNPKDSTYQITLAQGYVTQAQLEVLKTSPNMTTIQGLAQSAITALKQARENDAHNPYVYEQSAAVYDSMRNLVSNADELSAQAYALAIPLEPNSPMAYLNYGRAQLLAAETSLHALAADADKTAVYQAISQAIQTLEVAKNLKTNFAVADYSIAIGMELKGETDTAIAKLETLATQYPQDTDVLSGLASLYQKKEEYDRAIGLYRQIITLASDDSNAHWQLAMIYEKQDKKDEALSELNIVKQLNPDNATVQQEIDKLNK